MAVIAASLRNLRSHGKNFLDIQILPVIAGFGNHAASKIQPKALFDVFGFDVIPRCCDVISDLLGRAEQTGATTIHLEVDTEPLPPLAVHFADIDHASED